MKVELNLTDDMIKLIPFMYVKEDGDNKVIVERDHLFNIGAHLLDDMSLILGLRDKAIENTSDDAEGRAFPDDVEEYMLGIYNYLSERLLFIESLIHQYATKGGIKAGTYTCNSNELIWTRIINL